MLLVVHLAATALLLCPHAAAFMSPPSQLQQQQQQRIPSQVHNGAFAPAAAAAAAAEAAATTARRPPIPLPTRLAAADLGGSGGGAVRGDGRAGGGADGTKRKPPRSVLERPWDVEVDFHGERRVITVQPGDSILEAAEMSGMNLSYECRRGNCISCAAKVQDGSSGHFENRADRTSEDGAPDGFVLTCSTHPTGPGVKLELSANADMWQAYCAGLDDISTQDLLRQTSAGLMRKYRVEHPEYFREEVERQFNEPTT